MCCLCQGLFWWLGGHYFILYYFHVFFFTLLLQLILISRHHFQPKENHVCPREQTSHWASKVAPCPHFLILVQLLFGHQEEGEGWDEMEPRERKRCRCDAAFSSCRCLSTAVVWLGIKGHEIFLDFSRMTQTQDWAELLATFRVEKTILFVYTEMVLPWCPIFAPLGRFKWIFK